MKPYAIDMILGSSAIVSMMTLLYHNVKYAEELMFLICAAAVLFMVATATFVFAPTDTITDIGAYAFKITSALLDLIAACIVLYGITNGIHWGIQWIFS